MRLIDPGYAGGGEAPAVGSDHPRGTRNASVRTGDRKGRKRASALAAARRLAWNAREHGGWRVVAEQRQARRNVRLPYVIKPAVETMACPASIFRLANDAQLHVAHAVGQDRRQTRSNGMIRWNGVAEPRKSLRGFVIGATVMTTMSRDDTTRASSRGERT